MLFVWLLRVPFRSVNLVCVVFVLCGLFVSSVVRAFDCAHARTHARSIVRAVVRSVVRWCVCLFVRVSVLCCMFDMCAVPVVCVLVVVCLRCCLLVCLIAYLIGCLFF